MNYPDNKLSPLAQFVQPAATPAPKPKKQRASTPTATPAPVQPPRPTAGTGGGHMSPTAPTAIVNSISSAAEQAYTNPAIPPETRQTRTTSGPILPPPASLPPLIANTSGMVPLDSRTLWNATDLQQLRAIAAGQGINNPTPDQIRAIARIRDQQRFEQRRAAEAAYMSPTAPPQAAAAMSIAQDPADAGDAGVLLDVTSDGDKSKTLIVLGIVAVIVFILATE